MRAALFYGSGKPLEVEETATPEIAPDEILVKVAGCGICQSDLEYIDLGVRTAKKPPIVLGHEAAGTVLEMGASVSGLKIGDPVLLGNIISCGFCRNCREGRDNICDNWLMVKELDIVGSCSCRTADIPRVIELVRTGKINMNCSSQGNFPSQRSTRLLIGSDEGNP